MSYATVRGGEDAVKEAVRLEREAAAGSGLTIGAVQRGLRYAVDQVMGEAGLYAPGLAARAIVEAQGELAEAAFLLRAYRSTLARLGHTPARGSGSMRPLRRISSAFKDVPGGQVLGETRDYSQRLLGDAPERTPAAVPYADSPVEEDISSVTDLLRHAGLVREQEPEQPSGEPREPFDLTRQALKVPAPRSGRLQSLARGETGAMDSLAYSSLRGFGPAHPTLAEFRVGYLPLVVEHPHTGEELEVGEILCTEAESVEQGAGSGDEGNTLSLGYGLTFGRNERKAISMSVLDATIRKGKERAEGPEGPAEDEEFVLQHTDGVEVAGFIEHLKLPHYVTFQASLDRIRDARRESGDAEAALEH